MYLVTLYIAVYQNWEMVNKSEKLEKKLYFFCKLLFLGWDFLIGALWNRRIVQAIFGIAEILHKVCNSIFSLINYQQVLYDLNAISVRPSIRPGYPLKKIAKSDDMPFAACIWRSVGIWI